MPSTPPHIRSSSKSFEHWKNCYFSFPPFHSFYIFQLSLFFNHHSPLGDDLFVKCLFVFCVVPFLTNDPQPCPCCFICFWSFYFLISLYGVGSLASQVPSLVHSLICLLGSPSQLISIILSTTLRSCVSFLVSGFSFHLFGENVCYFNAILKIMDVYVTFGILS